VAIDAQQRDWQDLATLDPLWAILSEPDKQHSGWEGDAFFATGRDEVSEILGWVACRVEALHFGTALDFGCGVGRLTRALAERFEGALGLDISSAMVQQATTLNADVSNVTFVVGHQGQLPDQHFDFILTLIVLQHLGSRSDIERGVSGLCGRLAPGGVAVMGLPSFIPLRHRLQPRPRAYRALRRVGISSKLLYERLGLYPIRMGAVSERAMARIFADRGVDVVDTRVSLDPSGVRTMQYLIRRNA